MVLKGIGYHFVPGISYEGGSVGVETRECSSVGLYVLGISVQQHLIKEAPHDRQM